VLSHQDQLVDPHDLTVDCDGRMIFYVENQGVYIWATDSRGEDPVLQGRFDAEGEPWIKPLSTSLDQGLLNCRRQPRRAT
jgi:hypothetical protein